MLQHARTLAGGVSNLAAKIGIDAYVLDEMLHETGEIPDWVIERTAAFITDAEKNG